MERLHFYQLHPVSSVLEDSTWPITSLDSNPHMSPDPLATQLPPSGYDSLQHFLKAIPRFYNRLLSFHQQKVTDVEVWRAFRARRRLEIISDGSLANQTLGTFGWKIVTTKDTIFYQGTGLVDGPPETASSTRTELGGYAAPLLLFAAIARFWGLKHKCRY